MDGSSNMIRITPIDTLLVVCESCPGADPGPGDVLRHTVLRWGIIAYEHLGNCADAIALTNDKPGQRYVALYDLKNKKEISILYPRKITRCKCCGALFSLADNLCDHCSLCDLPQGQNGALSRLCGTCCVSLRMHPQTVGLPPKELGTLCCQHQAWMHRKLLGMMPSSSTESSSSSPVPAMVDESTPVINPSATLLPVPVVVPPVVDSTPVPVITPSPVQGKPMVVDVPASLPDPPAVVEAAATPQPVPELSSSSSSQTATLASTCPEDEQGAHDEIFGGMSAMEMTTPEPPATLSSSPSEPELRSASSSPTLREAVLVPEPIAVQPSSALSSLSGVLPDTLQVNYMIMAGKIHGITPPYTLHGPMQRYIVDGTWTLRHRRNTTKETRVRHGFTLHQLRKDQIPVELYNQVSSRWVEHIQKASSVREPAAPELDQEALIEQDLQEISLRNKRKRSSRVIEDSDNATQPPTPSQPMELDDGEGHSGITTPPGGEEDEAALLGTPWNKCITAAASPSPAKKPNKSQATAAAFDQTLQETRSGKDADELVRFPPSTRPERVEPPRELEPFKLAWDETPNCIDKMTQIYQFLVNCNNQRMIRADIANALRITDVTYYTNKMLQHGMLVYAEAKSNLPTKYGHGLIRIRQKYESIPSEWYKW